MMEDAGETGKCLPVSPGVPVVVGQGICLPEPARGGASAGGVWSPSRVLPLPQGGASGPTLNIPRPALGRS